MNSAVEAKNPFGSGITEIRPSAAGNALAQTDQQRAIAEVQSAMMIARMNPRDQIVAMDRILNSCTRPTLAEAAIYQYSRGGTDISGPSIRLAEAIAQQWGNINFGIRELEQRNGESVIQAYCWDVETNTRREVTFVVPHVRDTKYGRKKLEDARDIYETVANMGSRRLRACILAVIPGDVVEAALDQCERTMKSKADTSPEAMKKMIESFVAFGVSKEQIEKRIQRRLDAIQPAQVVALKKIYASLRDGMSVAADWFEIEEQAEDKPEIKNRTEQVKEAIKKKAQPTAAKQQEDMPSPEPKPEPEPMPEEIPTEPTEMSEDLRNATHSEAGGTNQAEQQQNTARTMGPRRVRGNLDLGG